MDRIDEANQMLEKAEVAMARPDASRTVREHFILVPGAKEPVRFTGTTQGRIEFIGSELHTSRWAAGYVDHALRESVQVTGNDEGLKKQLTSYLRRMR